MKKIPLRAKVKVAGTHLFISLFIFLLVVLWTRLIAYPAIYFSLSGAIYALVIVFCVDVVLGPLLSFLLYSPAKPKKSMRLDFGIIACIQLLALTYGLYTLYQERPEFVIIYPNSTATVLSHREVTELPEIEVKQYSQLAGLPTGVLHGKDSYSTLNQAHDIIAKTNHTTRKFIAQSGDMDNQKMLSEIDQRYHQPYVLAIMAKYNGAYIVLDKELNYLTIFGERPIN